MKKLLFTVLLMAFFTVSAKEKIKLFMSRVSDPIIVRVLDTYGGKKN